MTITLVLEYLFMAMAFLVLCMSFFSLREAIADEAFVNAKGQNGHFKLVADRNVLEELFRISVGMVMLIVSVLAWLLKPPPPDYHAIPQVFATMLGYNIIGAIMIIGSFYSRYSKRKLLQYSQQQGRRRDDGSKSDI